MYDLQKNVLNFLLLHNTKPYLNFTTCLRIGMFVNIHFNFLGKEEAKPTLEKRKEFKRLLNLFIKNYSIQITANTKFAQCSPTTYIPK